MFIYHVYKAYEVLPGRSLAMICSLDLLDCHILQVVDHKVAFIMSLCFQGRIYHTMHLQCSLTIILHILLVPHMCRYRVHLVDNRTNKTYLQFLQVTNHVYPIFKCCHSYRPVVLHTILLVQFLYEQIAWKQWLLPTEAIMYLFISLIIHGAYVLTFMEGSPIIAMHKHL